MNKEQAFAVLVSLHNLAISSGLYKNVEAVNHVSVALRILQDSLTDKNTTDGNKQRSIETG